jgi:hypothetical protein
MTKEGFCELKRLRNIVISNQGYLEPLSIQAFFLTFRMKLRFPHISNAVGNTNTLSFMKGIGSLVFLAIHEGYFYEKFRPLNTPHPPPTTKKSC